jgi:uncharacterized flavoprotein (TIGR03862 family)
MRALIVGAGPAGLMAADVLSAAGVAVDIYDAMPSPARKLLRAGVGGLNLTHSEDPARFITRYGAAQSHIAPWLAQFDAHAVQAWAEGLGCATFVGSSGRVFPQSLKAAPLLRAWLARLRAQGVRLYTRHRWQGWDADGALRFATPDGFRYINSKISSEVSAGNTAIILAMGGASWPRLGATGDWAAWLALRGVPLTAFAPSNVGVRIQWSSHLLRTYTREPLKNVRLHIADQARIGECLLTPEGLEGGLIYAFSAPIREALARDGAAHIQLDLAPERTLTDLIKRLAGPRGRLSLSNHLRRQIGLTGIKAALLREGAAAEDLGDPKQIAQRIKALPLTITATGTLDKAISSAGGVSLDALDARLMLHALPGVFCAGEMLDWDAPTGGYLLTACLASGRVAAHGALDYLAARRLSA